MDKITHEKVQVLLGERGDKTKAAVRRAEIAEMNLQRVAPATAAPTMAEFNALVEAYNTLIVKLADLARK